MAVTGIIQPFLGFHYDIFALSSRYNLLYSCLVVVASNLIVERPKRPILGYSGSAQTEKGDTDEEQPSQCDRGLCIPVKLSTMSQFSAFPPPGVWQTETLRIPVVPIARPGLPLGVEKCNSRTSDRREEMGRRDHSMPRKD